MDVTPKERLDSWKEIATYLRRDERTVRRWEKQEGLPVKRHLHLKQSSVYAYCSELDAWRSRRGPARLSGWGFALMALLWAVIYNVLTGTFYLKMVRSRGLANLHPLLGARQSPQTGQIAGMLLVTLLMGMSAVWILAVVRQRTSSNGNTIGWTAFAVWGVWGLLPVLPSVAMRQIPLVPLTWEMAAKAVVVVVATWVTSLVASRIATAQ